MGLAVVLEAAVAEGVVHLPSVLVVGLGWSGWGNLGMLCHHCRYSSLVSNKLSSPY